MTSLDMLAWSRGFGVLLMALAVGCGTSVVEEANAGNASASSAGAGGFATATGTGGVAEGGAGGAGGAVLADAGVRLSQGEPECLLHGGAVTCYRQLEDGEQSPPGPWDVAGIDDAREVTFAIEQACVRRATGKVACVGWNHHGQLGLAIAIGATTVVPVELPEVQVERLATGHHAVCGIESSGQAICWGGAYAGPLGNPNVGQTQAPIDVVGVPDAVDVAMAMERACAVRADGSVLCWGQAESPVVVPGIQDAVKVAVCASYGSNLTACALRSDGTLACWADSGAVPVAGIDGVVQLSGATFGHSICARTADGRVFCLTGAGVQGPDLSVTEIDVHDAIDVSAGTEGLCAVRAGGSVACWGYGGGVKSFPL